MHGRKGVMMCITAQAGSNISGKRRKREQNRHLLHLFGCETFPLLNFNPRAHPFASFQGHKTTALTKIATIPPDTH